jgi:hypothetical protein
VSVRDDATKVGGGVIADASAKNDRLGILLLEELEHGLKWERAAHIAVEHEESVGPTFHDSISEVVETTCCS